MDYRVTNQTTTAYDPQSGKTIYFKKEEGEPWRYGYKGPKGIFTWGNVSCYWKEEIIDRVCAMKVHRDVTQTETVEVTHKAFLHIKSPVTGWVVAAFIESNTLKGCLQHLEDTTGFEAIMAFNSLERQPRNAFKMKVISFDEAILLCARIARMAAVLV